MNQKYILVTGASRGIGRSIALKFAREGYHVFLNCRTSLNELEEVQNKILSMPGGSCTITTGDVGDPDQVRRMFQEIHKICPGLDVLVTDCIGSRRESDREMAIRRAEQEGAVLTSSEAILFELLKEAGTPLSKEILKIVK